jgi:hypothetical protein
MAEGGAAGEYVLVEKRVGNPIRGGRQRTDRRDRQKLPRPMRDAFRGVPTARRGNPARQPSLHDAEPRVALFLWGLPTHARLRTKGRAPGGLTAAGCSFSSLRLRGTRTRWPYGRRVLSLLAALAGDSHPMIRRPRDDRSATPQIHRGNALLPSLPEPGSASGLRRPRRADDPPGHLGRREGPRGTSPVALQSGVLPSSGLGFRESAPTVLRPGTPRRPAAPHADLLFSAMTCGDMKMGLVRLR